MSSYLIAQVTVTDPARYAIYLKDFRAVLKHYDGELLAADKARTLEGSWDNTHTVILRFSDDPALQRWYDSPEYRKILQHRHSSANVNIGIVSDTSEQKI